MDSRVRLVPKTIRVVGKDSTRIPTEAIKIKRVFAATLKTVNAIRSSNMSWGEHKSSLDIILSRDVKIFSSEQDAKNNEEGLIYLTPKVDISKIREVRGLKRLLDMWD